jgi:hypothetical protein
MSNNRFYFVNFNREYFDLGVEVGIYPHLHLWIILPFIEFRMGVNLK